METATHLVAENNSTVLVEPVQLEAFNARLAALNKKAEKFGLEPIKILSTTNVLYKLKSEVVDSDGEKVLHSLVPARQDERTAKLVNLKRIVIQYPAIKLGVWQVIGKLEVVEGGNLSFCVTTDPQDMDVVRERASNPIHCQHCETKRRRKDAFLLREADTHRYREVGSNCLMDFTGIDPAAALFLARMWTLVNTAIDDLQEFCRGGRGNAVDTQYYLAMVSFLAENFGFVSSAKSRDTGQQPTFEWALSLSWDMTRMKQEFRRKYAEQEDRHYTRTQAIREWAATLPEQTDFNQNVKLLLKADQLSLDRKHLALAAAAVHAFNRSQAKQAESRQPSMHVGKPGQKLTCTVTITRIIAIETAYGRANLVMMRDDVGNVLKWKTGSCPYEIQKDGVGRTLQATFKVKEHGEYKGMLQTSVTHLKINL